jgi:hypothetical protein
VVVVAWGFSFFCPEISLSVFFFFEIPPSRLLVVHDFVVLFFISFASNRGVFLKKALPPSSEEKESKRARTAVRHRDRGREPAFVVVF